MIKEAQKHLIMYEGKLITVRKLCLLTKSDYRSVQRRLKAGMSPEKAAADLVDRRGNAKNVLLVPSQVLTIYAMLFNGEKTQTLIAKEFNVHQSTISDIWRHKRWDWLTAPLRYELEQRLGDID